MACAASLWDQSPCIRCSILQFISLLVDAGMDISMRIVTKVLSSSGPNRARWKILDLQRV